MYVTTRYSAKLTEINKIVGNGPGNGTARQPYPIHRVWLPRWAACVHAACTHAAHLGFSLFWTISPPYTAPPPPLLLPALLYVTV